MQCDNRNKWYHNMRTKLTPAEYKRRCKPCCPQKSWLILEAIGLLNTARTIPSDRQPLADKQLSYVGEAESIIMSPPIGLNKTTKLDPYKVVGNKYTYVAMVSKKKRKYIKKEQISERSKIYKFTTQTDREGAKPEQCIRFDQETK